MAKPKGLPKSGGRQKGTPNKSTAQLKAAIEGAFAYCEEHGEGFNVWALKNETIFYTQIAPKLLPVQLNHADADGEKLTGINVNLVGPHSQR